jgi:hypothetical protein
MSDPAPGVPYSAIVTPPLDSSRAEILVFHVNIFILGIIVLLVLPSVPRMFARLWSRSEWCNGHILLDRPYQPPTTVAQSYRNAYPPPNSKEVATDDSHTLFSHSNQPRRVDGKGKPIIVSYPPHIASSFRLFRPLLVTLRHRLSPGFSAGQFIILLYYFGILIYAAFYESSPFTDPLRAGWVAIGQFPFVFAFGTKNNVLAMLFGSSYAQVSILRHVPFPCQLTITYS